MVETKKPWYTSKTLFINIVWIIAFIIQYAFNKVIYPEEQIVILGFINVILRLITNKQLE